MATETANPLTKTLMRLMTEVTSMRKHQRRYYNERAHSALLEAKNAERRVDKTLDELKLMMQLTLPLSE
jgi:hypothetical protein